MSLWSIIVAVLFSNALAFPRKDLSEDEDRVKDGEFSVVADEGSSIGADEGSSVGADESSDFAADEMSRAIKKIFKIWPPHYIPLTNLVWANLVSASCCIRVSDSLKRSGMVLRLRYMSSCIGYYYRNIID